MNKLTSALITGALLLATSIPAFAMGGESYGNYSRGRNQILLTNNASIENNVASIANTGGIFVDPNNNNVCTRHLHSSSPSLDITTGDANSNVGVFVGDTGGINVTNNLPSRGRVTVHNSANITNNVLSVANTGLVFVSPSSRGGSTSILTGNANSQAQVVVENVNVTGF